MNLLFIYFMMIALYNPVFNGMNLSNYFLLFGFTIILIFKNISLKVYNYKKPNVLLCFLFLIYMGISLVYSTNQSVSIPIIIKLVIPFIFGVLLLNTIKTKKDFNKFVSILVFAGSAAAVYGCIQYYFGLSDYALTSIGGVYIYRAIGAFQQANVFASFLVLLMPFIVYKISNAERKLSKLIYFSFFAVTSLCLYLTYSRWAIICAIGACGYYLLKWTHYQFKNKSFRLKRRTVFLSPIVIGMTIYVLNKYSDAINSLFISRESNGIRQANLSIAIDKFSHNIMGYGLGNGNSGLIMDGTFLNLLLDTGIIGVGLFVIILMVIFTGIRRSSEGSISLGNIYNITAISFVVFVLNGLLETILYNSVINIFLGIYLFVLNADKNIFNSKDIVEPIKHKEIKRITSIELTHAKSI